MPRPHKCRCIGPRPAVNTFKPAGVPHHNLETVTLRLDELEALRLVDLEGLYQDAAAERMNVSRPTLGRLLEAARRKVADALVNGKALVIDGGTVAVRETAADAAACPTCGAEDIHPPDEPSGHVCRRRRRCGWGGGHRGRCGGHGHDQTQLNTGDQ